jgi:hypothetical protein
MVVARGATATDQFALDSGLSIIIRSDGGLERFVIFSVLQCADHCLCCEAMADRIAAGSLLASLSFRPRAL